MPLQFPYSQTGVLVDDCSRTVFSLVDAALEKVYELGGLTSERNQQDDNKEQPNNSSISSFF